MFTGELFCEKQEQVGKYEIGIGTLTCDDNYVLNFKPDYLTIFKRNITIKADDLNKVYLDEDPEFTYQIVDGSLVFDDEIIGQCYRQQGEFVGDYAIYLDQLQINDNYQISVIVGALTIVPREVSVSVLTLSKVYGEQDPEFDYVIAGKVGDGDTFGGNIGRVSGEKVGFYEMICSLENQNYIINFDQTYFEIVKKEITIKANDVEVEYGHEVPELTFKVIDGEVLPGNEFSGSLYKMPGVEVGIYEIKSTLNLGINYKINFISGELTIVKTSLTIQGEDITVVYGDTAGEIGYQIVEGQLYYDDEIYGEITFDGVDVGEYVEICNLYNQNYNINFISGKVTITPKSVFLSTVIKDKVYDGSVHAQMGVPSVSGLIDAGIKISYNEMDCAEFEDAEVGNNKNVYLKNIKLVGEKSGNYTLYYPTLTANITAAKIEISNVELSCDNAILYEGTKLTITEDTNSKVSVASNKEVLQSLKLAVTRDDKDVEIDDVVTISVKLNKTQSNFQNIKVYQVAEDGKLMLLESDIENGNVIFSSQGVGEYIIIADNDFVLNLTTILCSVLLFVAALLFVIGEIIKYKRKKLKI